MMLPLSFALVAFYWSQATCQDLKKNQICVDAVYEAYGSLTFEGSDVDDYWGATCNNTLKVNSIYAAAKKYCKASDLEPGFTLLRNYCSEYGEVELLPMSDFADNLTESYIDSMRIVEYEEIPATENITTAVMISRAYFEASYRTVTVWEFEEWAHHTYGFALYGFWGGVLLLAMTSRLINAVFHKRLSRASSDPEHNAPLKNSSPSSFFAPALSVRHWVRANIIIPTAFGSHHQRLFYWCAVPTRIEAIIIFSYWSINIILSSVNYRAFTGNLYWSKISPQVWCYVADRTGIMAYANLPIIWMFSGRNNIFIWATGWSFSIFNIFHRHVARIATLQAITHAIAYTHMYIDEGYYKEELAEVWFIMGIVAVVLMSSLLLFSSVWLRKWFYEVFLLVHIAFSVVIIIALFYHTSIYEGEYDPYLWPPVAIWSFDRFLRFVRLVACNISLRFNEKKLQHTKATATYSKETNVVRLEVIPGSAVLKQSPGQHYFLYQPLSWRGYENHPFTLGAWSSTSKENRSRPTFSDSSRKAEKDIEVSTAPVSSDSALSSSTQDHVTTAHAHDIRLIFWIRPFNGFTRRLRDDCIKATDGVALRSDILIEGPYGERTPMNNYETVILIAGGTGISAAVPYIQDHVRRSLPRQEDSHVIFSTRTRHIELIWTCRQAAFIKDVANKELLPALARDDVHSSFFCTKSSEEFTPSSSAASEISPVDNKDFSLTQSPGSDVKIEHGRPDIKAAILQTARNIQAEGSAAGRMAILVCGPAGMADEARAAVHIAMKGGCRSIEYVEEAFGW